jgi:succinate dehydrogenase / fumarate reductase flavoprotein subunit
MVNDIIVVGSGGSALSCAITLKQRGYDVIIVTKTTNTASQTVQAQGGINAVLNSKKDSVKSHI